jgi:hypothetical protein
MNSIANLALSQSITIDSDISDEETVTTFVKYMTRLFKRSSPESTLKTVRIEMGDYYVNIRSVPGSSDPVIEYLDAN